MKVFFDLDGTLTDPKEGIVRCIQYALAKLNVPAPTEAALANTIGPPLRDGFSDILHTENQDLIERAIFLYRERFQEVGMYENAIYPGIPELLSALCGHNDTLYVATSKPRVYAKKIIDHFELSPYFNEVYGSELDGRLSDKGALLGHLLNSEGLSAEEAIMIGDRKHDILGAWKNGIDSIGVLWGYGSYHELEQAGASFICDEPAKIFDWIV